MIMKTKRSFHLRFYGQSLDNVERCVSELKSALPGIIGHKVFPGLDSMNAHTAPSHEVDLYFSTSDEVSAMHANAMTKNIYMRYAAPGRTAALHVRNPGQPMFRHKP